MSRVGWAVLSVVDRIRAKDLGGLIVWPVAVALFVAPIWIAVAVSLRFLFDFLQLCDMLVMFSRRTP